MSLLVGDKNFDFSLLISLLSGLSFSDDKMYWVSDPSYRRFFYLSPGYQDLLGLPPDVLCEDFSAWKKVVFSDRSRPDPVSQIRAASCRHHQYKRFQLCYSIKRADGVVRRVKDCGFPFWDQTGRCVALVGGLVNLSGAHTERHQSHYALMNQVGHHLKGPMANIVMLSNMLLGANPRLEQKEFLTDIFLSAKALMAFSSKMLDLVAADTGPALPPAAPFDLKAVLADIKSQYLPSARYKKLKFFIEVAPDLPQIFIGQGLKIQALLSLFIDNAIRFTKKGMVVCEVSGSTVDESDSDYELIVSIRDTGVGLCEPVLLSLPSYFTSIDVHLSDHFYRHIGLGFRLAREYCLDLNAHFFCRDSLFGGTELSLTLPLALEKAPVPA